jgi:hypothetical protein
MADRIDLTLRPKSDVQPIDLKTTEMIGRVARAETVELGDAVRVRLLVSAGGCRHGARRPSVASRDERG